MRSYALFILALAVFHARAANIPTPVEAEKKPDEKNSLDNVSLDNNDSEQELIDQANSLKDVVNNRRKSASIENVPVKVIEEQPVIKTVALKEDSNDYIPDIDDTTIIKRLEIDLKNPGPPQRQEHDSQNPTYYVDRERAVAAVKQSITKSENIFKSGIQNVAQNFQNFFANNEELPVIKQNIQNLRDNVNGGFSNIADTINSYLKPAPEEGAENQVELYSIEKVKTHLGALETKFNTGVDILSEGVEILSILKEQEEGEVKSEKISGKADNAAEASTSTGTSPPNPGPGSGTSAPAQTNPVKDFMQNFYDGVTGTFQNMTLFFQNAINSNQNSQNQNQNQTQSFNFLQDIPNPFQVFNQNQNQAQGTVPAGAQSDETTTKQPNIFDVFHDTWQNMFNKSNNQQQQPQQNQNPITFMYQGLANLFQRPTAAPQTNQPTNQANNAAVSQPASDTPVAVAPATAQGSNSVPAPLAPPAPAAQVAPTVPVVAQPTQNAVQPGPIQQIVQNNPIVKGIAQAVQRIQGSSNPSTPRDKPTKDEETKGHGPTNAATGDNHVSGIDVQGVAESQTSPVKDEPETKPVSETQTAEQGPAAEPNKTE